jgi:putative membrane protein
MRFVGLTALTAAPVLAAPAWGQGPGPWQMHDPLDWGMWFGPLFMLTPLALLIIAIVALVRWLSGRNAERGRRVPTARDILDERYARGEVDRDDYLRRRDDMAGH